MEALARGEVAVVSFAGGVGSRWTRGAGVVKALNPFCRLEGRHRSFLEVHFAVLGVLIILVVLFLPGGLMSLLQRYFPQKREQSL